MEPALRNIDGKMYNTKTADIVAHGSFLGGYRGDQLGRSQILYKTKKGEFFIFYETAWEDELDRLEAVSCDEAQALYRHLLCTEMDYFEAFGFEPEES